MEEKEIDYLIQEAKYGMGPGGMCCGPVSGPVIVTVKINDGEKSTYITCSDYDGFPIFFSTENDIFDYLTGKVGYSDEMNDFLEKSEISYFADIYLDDEGDAEIYENISKSKNVLAGKFIRYILALDNLTYEETDILINNSVNKHISEFEVPKTRTEIYLEGLQEEQQSE